MEILLRQIRQRKGITQDKLAREVGVGRSTISDIETGKHIPRVDIALSIARALNCRVEDIFTLEGDRYEIMDRQGRK